MEYVYSAAKEMHFKDMLDALNALRKQPSLLQNAGKMRKKERNIESGEKKEVSNSVKRKKANICAQSVERNFRNIINIARVSHAEKGDRINEEQEEITVKLLENE